MLSPSSWFHTKYVHFGFHLLISKTYADVFTSESFLPTASRADRWLSYEGGDLEFNFWISPFRLRPSSAPRYTCAAHTQAAQETKLKHGKWLEDGGSQAEDICWFPFARLAYVHLLSPTPFLLLCGWEMWPTPWGALSTPGEWVAQAKPTQTVSMQEKGTLYLLLWVWLEVDSEALTSADCLLRHESTQKKGGWERTKGQHHEPSGVSCVWSPWSGIFIANKSLVLHNSDLLSIIVRRLTSERIIKLTQTKNYYLQDTVPSTYTANLI